MSSKENHWFPLAQYQETRGWRGGSAAALKVQPPLAIGVVQREREKNCFSHEEELRLLPANNFRSPLKGRRVLERLLVFVCDGVTAVMGRDKADPVEARRARGGPRQRLLPAVESS